MVIIKMQVLEQAMIYVLLHVIEPIQCAESYGVVIPTQTWT